MEELGGRRGGSGVGGWSRGGGVREWEWAWGDGVCVDGVGNTGWDRGLFWRVGC